MTLSEYTCTCGATLRYKQDLTRERGAIDPGWKCKQCGTPVPAQVGEKLSHQHPS